MAIVMIQGPAGPEGRTPADTVQNMLGARARNAGQELVRYECANEAQLVERLARIDRGQADIILLDPGRCTGENAPLQNTLNHLQVPYIEVHEEIAAPRDQGAQQAVGPRVAVVEGYAAQSYTLAMSLALETLGCADSENDFNVGT